MCRHEYGDFKTKMSANFEDKRKRWLGASGIGREAGPPSAPQRRVHATTGKAKTEKDTKGTKYNLFGDGAKKGKGSSHITYAVRAPTMPKVFVCVKEAWTSGSRTRRLR